QQKALRKKRAQITISGHWTPSSSCDAESSEFKSVQQHGEDIMKKMAIEAYQDVLKSVKLCSGSGDNQHQSTIDWTETEKLFARLRTLLDRCCPRPAGFCPVELALEFANAAQLPLLPPAAVAALKASAVGAPAVSSATPTRIDLHFEPGMSTDTGSPVSTPRSPMPLVVTAAVDIDDAASLASSADKRIPREPTGLRASQSDECDDDEEEPDIDISSFMSCDPNFNRETPDSQSMEKALTYPAMSFKPAMLVFLHSLLAKKEAKWYKPLNFVLFDWIADDWRRREFPPKQAKRTAYALYATYLHRDAPLNLQASLQATDPELGLPRLELADSVRGLTELFTKQPTDAQVERISTRLNDLQDRLAPLGDILVRSIGQEVLAKRRDGFVSDILPAIDSLREDLSEEKQQLFLNKSRPIMQAHLQFLASASFGGDLEAGCLATVLEHVFHLRPGDTAANDFWPAAVLNCPRQSRGGAGRRSSATFEKRGPHLLRLVELDRLHPCSACGRLLAGPGPQGYVCTVGDCEVAAHKSCMDKVKPISCTTSKLSILARSLSSSRESSKLR
uniref:Phorbol-ester/DAG-type domain-containing protein n=1 Tax=Macrostomum lignano TaxID=282301 RepID=A0A1I8H296_9PLAT